jgi:WD40 repeat protein
LGNRAAGQEALLLKGHIEPDRPLPKVKAVAYSPDGRWLASAGELAYRVIIWDAATGEKVRSFDDPGLCACFAFSSDGRSLALTLVGEDARLVVVYEVATWKERLRCKLEFLWVDELVFSSDGRFLACRQQNLVFLVHLRTAGNPPSPTRFEVEKAQFYSGRLLFSPDSKQLIAGFGGELSYRDVSSGREVLNQPLKTALWDLALLPDGKTLVLLNHGWEECPRVLQFRDSPTGKWRVNIDPPPTGHGFLAVAAKEDVIVTGGGRSLLIFKGRDRGTEFWATRFIHKGTHIRALSVSPDGKRIATANSDGTVSLIDVPNEKEEFKKRPPDE